MTTRPALQWLCEEFEPALRRYQRHVRARSSMSTGTARP